MKTISDKVWKKKEQKFKEIVEGMEKVLWHKFHEIEQQDNDDMAEVLSDICFCLSTLIDRSALVIGRTLETSPADVISSIKAMIDAMSNQHNRVSLN